MMITKLTISQPRAEVERGTYLRKSNKYNFMETKSIIKIYLKRWCYSLGQVIL